jgi:hypothetical protein
LSVASRSAGVDRASGGPIRAHSAPA